MLAEYCGDQSNLQNDDHQDAKSSLMQSKKVNILSSLHEGASTAEVVAASQQNQLMAREGSFADYYVT